MKSEEQQMDSKADHIYPFPAFLAPPRSSSALIFFGTFDVEQNMTSIPARIGRIRCEWMRLNVRFARRHLFAIASDYCQFQSRSFSRSRIPLSLSHAGADCGLHRLSAIAFVCPSPFALNSESFTRHFSAYYEHTTHEI